MPVFKGPKEIAVADTLIRNREAERERVEQQRLADLRRLKEQDPNRLIGNMLAERYMVQEKIGEGGMGTIYLAEDTKISKKVAIKVLPKILSKAPIVTERFVREAKVATRIGHENVIDVTDLGTTPDGVPFFVMEYLRGSDLYQKEREGILGWNRDTSDIILQVCRALSAAHEKDIIHRDMKPENVFLLERSDGKAFVKVLDFGIAKLLEEAQVLEEGEDGQIVVRNERITQAGVVMGTPSYMAPEQARGADIDHRVDIYAVGTILYEMVSGYVPFDPEGYEGMQRAHMILEMQKTEEPLPPSRKNSELKLPPELEAVIMRALRKDPLERFQTMKEMEEAIAALAAPEVSRVSLKPREIRMGSMAIIGYHEIKKAERARITRRRTKILAAVFAAVAAGSAVTYKLDLLDYLMPPAVYEKGGK